jgi:hypothetical protein
VFALLLLLLLLLLQELQGCDVALEFDVAEVCLISRQVGGSYFVWQNLSSSSCMSRKCRRWQVALCCVVAS